jgi:hypothetical protein
MEELNKVTARAFARLAKIFFYVVLFAASCLGAYLDWHSAGRYSLWAAAGVVLVIAVPKVIRRIRRQKPGKSNLSVWDTLGVAVVCGVAVFVFYSVGIGFYSAYKFAISSDLSRPTSLTLVALVTFIVGITLFVLRLRWRCLYGISEALVGIVVASQRYYTDALLAATPTPSVALAILTAGVYLVVRGADNIHQGLTKPPFDPIGQRFLNWVNTEGHDNKLTISTRESALPEKTDTGRRT